MHDDTSTNAPAEPSSQTGPETGKAASDPVRTALRFPLKLPVRLQTAGGEVEGTTENVSSSGLLFLTDKTLEINSRVDFTLAIPAAVLGTATDISVQCVGRVIRHEQTPEDQMAAAIVIDEYTFEA